MMNRAGAMIATCFLAGLLAALIQSLLVWAAGSYGLTEMVGVKINPTLTLPWLYQRMIWGGIWGLAYFFLIGSPKYYKRWIRKGLWIAILPTALQLFYIFPYKTDFGMLGSELGTFTPLFVLVANIIWGCFTGIFTRLLWGRN